jgi:hypothetical protein
MCQLDQEYVFENMIFSPDEKEVSLVFRGYDEPFQLRQRGGLGQATFIAETLEKQRLVVTSYGRTVYLNKPLILALQDWL